MSAEENKAVVRRFVAEVRNKGNLDALNDLVVPEKVEEFREQAARLHRVWAEYHVTIKELIAEGDLVAIHNNPKSNPKDRGRSVVDIFRLENGKVVEHWDAVQDVPEKSANSNTMF